MMIYHFLKILFNGNPFTKVVNLMRLIPKVLRYEGWVGLYQRTKLGLIYFRQRVTRPYEVEQLESEGFSVIEGQNDRLTKVAIIVPTKNGGLEFETAMRAFSMQKGIGEVEIIIVDSGSEDKTVEVAARFGVNIFHIRPEHFNHGLTRNFGAEQTHGEYAVFTVQDAIPLNEYWLQSMVALLERDASIAAVTCRQFLREDADLFAKFMNHIQYESMGMKHNEVRFVHNTEDYQSLSPGDRRKLSQLDNVCCCFRKNVFDLYKFRKVKYAEDLEIGSRLARDGYKLAFLSSNGVIHSHNRSSVHFLKRSYTDARLAPKVLGYCSGVPILPRGITLEDIFSDMRKFYSYLGRLLGLVNWAEDRYNVISYLESCLVNGLKAIPSRERCIDEEMEAFLQEFQYMMDRPKEEVGRKWANIFTDGFIWNLGRFKKYAFTEGTNLEFDPSESISALFKLLGLWFGSYLGTIMNAAERQGNKLIYQEQIDTLLSTGL